MTNRKPPNLKQFPFHFEAQTRWDDNDIYGHLNNTVHYRLFDTAVNSFLVQNNVLDFRNSEHVYLVIETGCTYFAELAYPDPLIVGVGIAHLGNSSVRYHTALFKKGDKGPDEVVAAAAGHFVSTNETVAAIKVDAAKMKWPSCGSSALVALANRCLSVNFDAATCGRTQPPPTRRHGAAAPTRR